MDDLADGQIEFKVHGIPHINNSEVPAGSFANRLRALVSALEAADEVANGKPLHLYTIAKLHTSEPTAILNERPKPRLFVDQSASAFPVFERGVEAIKTGARASRENARFAGAIRRLTSGAGGNFAFAEVRTTKGNVVRVDEFLAEQAKNATRPREIEGIPEGGWFKGAVLGSFDGKLEYVDLRGSLPQIKLTLSAGAKQIDCVCRHDAIEALGDALAHRVRVTGRAIYDGRTGLPRRVEVTDITPVAEGADFSRWKGAFYHFELQAWDESEI